MASGEIRVKIWRPFKGRLEGRITKAQAMELCHLLQVALDNPMSEDQIADRLARRFGITKEEALEHLKGINDGK